MSRTPPASPAWPLELVAACADVRTVPRDRRDGPRARLWLMLHAALFAAARAQARRVATASAEDLEDIASAKALELLRRAEEGAWDPAGRPPFEIAGFVARVARNGLIDLARRRGHEVPASSDDGAWDAPVEDPAAAPEEALAAREFVTALRACVGALAPRSRQVWFRRVYHGVASRELAVLTGLRAAHVDVIVSRARAVLRGCMEGKGFRSEDVQPGAFAVLWPEVEHEWREHAGGPFAKEGGGDDE
jgi:RNA polymerase sigma factor (sigma-70 family)